MLMIITNDASGQMGEQQAFTRTCNAHIFTKFVITYANNGISPFRTPYYINRMGPFTYISFYITLNERQSVTQK